MAICPHYLDMYERIRKIVKVPPNNKSSKSKVKCKILNRDKNKVKINLVNNHFDLMKENRILLNKVKNLKNYKINTQKKLNHNQNLIDSMEREIRRLEEEVIQKETSLDKKNYEYKNKISSMNQEFIEYNKELDYYKEKYKEQEKFCDICWSTIMDEKEIFTCSTEKCKNIFHKSCCEKIRDNKCPFCRVELLKLPEISEDLDDSDINMENVNIEVVNVNEVVLHWD